MSGGNVASELRFIDLDGVVKEVEPYSINRRFPVSVPLIFKKLVGFVRALGFFALFCTTFSSGCSRLPFCWLSVIVGFCSVCSMLCVSICCSSCFDEGERSPS